jgi:hypothetical protein
MHHEMPQPTPEHRKLAAMAGSWTSFSFRRPSLRCPPPGRVPDSQEPSHRRGGQPGSQAQYLRWVSCAVRMN